MVCRRTNLDGKRWRGGAALLATLVLAGPAAAEEDGAAKLRRLRASAADFELGVSAQRRNELDLAHDAYTTALEKDPEFVEAMVNLARVHIALGAFADAERWLIEAHRTRPEYPGIVAAHGLLELELGNPTHAATELGHARAQSPDDPEILINLGAALLRQGRATEAIATLDRAIRLDPTSTPAALNLALAHDRMGDAQRAAFFYARFLDTADRSDPDRGAIRARLVELRPGVAAAGPETPQREGLDTISDPLVKNPVRSESNETTVSPSVAANGGNEQ